MWQLFQFPLCPFSRKVRLVLAEKGVGHELVRENPWEKRDEFIDLNPAGETPVMVEPDQGVTLIGSQPIVEYFDETVDRMPMIHGNARAPRRDPADDRMVRHQALSRGGRAADERADEEAAGQPRKSRHARAARGDAGRVASISIISIICSTTAAGSPDRA